MEVDAKCKVCVVGRLHMDSSFRLRGNIADCGLRISGRYDQCQCLQRSGVPYS